jgi:hypothetical protein
MSEICGHKKHSSLPVINVRELFLFPRRCFVRKPVVNVCGTQDRIDLHTAPPDRHRLRVASPAVRMAYVGREQDEESCNKNQRINGW